MTPRQQIKSLSVTSDPITAGLSQETDVPPDNNHITDACIHCLMLTINEICSLMCFQTIFRVEGCQKDGEQQLQWGQIMAHSLGYLTDIDRQPDRKERSQEKQSSSMMWQLRRRSEPTYVSMARILIYFNKGNQFGDWGMSDRSEVCRWSRITWSCLGDMEDRKVTSVIAIW